MNHNLSFSIIIPTFNRSDFIIKSVESALNQEYKNFEIIVVNDGSTDQTIETLKTISDSRFRVINIANSERAAARNRGVEVAKGDYITFLDSDDIYYPNYLSNANNSLIKKGTPKFFHQAYEIKNEEGKRLNYNSNFGNGIKFLIKGNPLSCLGVFVKREIALQFPFVEDRRLAGSEDWELWIRLAANYGLIKDGTITSCLIVHDDRSVLKVDQEHLLLRKQLLLHYVFHDNKVNEVFGKNKNKMIAYTYTYSSLHLILDGKPLTGFKYFIKAILKYPLCIFDRRTLGIIKHLFIQMFKN
ncbi:MAG: glycosyltransferase family 2 protein [Bacteroidia bacterium]